MTGRINSFQSLGTVDGPGVRSVVFMQGCTLRCPYCHNPDTWEKSGGTLLESGEVIEKVLRYKSYFGETGGVTVSGGEPLLQADFVREVFEGLKKESVSTALDTSGTIMNDSVKALLEVTDIVLLDIKFSDDEKYRKYIGVPLSRVLEFLNLCEEMKKRVIIRQVVTPMVNDAEKDIIELSEIVKQYSCIEKTELLPFRKLCIEKYENEGIAFPFLHFEEMPQKRIEELQDILK